MQEMASYIAVRSVSLDDEWAACKATNRHAMTGRDKLQQLSPFLLRIGVDNFPKLLYKGMFGTKAIFIPC